MVRSLVINSSPLVSVMPALFAKLITSPTLELAMVCRKDPGPLSASEVTKLVPPQVWKARSLP